MLIFLAGLVLTTVLIATVGRRAHSRGTDLGSMSNNWLAAHQAAQHASSL